jgi:aminoglycoside phosphotransferase family enzyme/predicted kinase
MANAAEAGSEDQSEVIAFLSDPSSYPERLEKVERCETHAALVFLAGDEAWKIKRAVRFPYLDFSTLEKRHAACLREVEINRGLAPEIYLGCVPIMRRSDGRLALGGKGDVVEWAVRMRRFDQAALLSNVAEAGDISAELAKILADRVFDSHQGAAPAPHAAGRERIGRLVTSVSGALAALDPMLSQAESVQFAKRAGEQIARAGAVLDRRAAQGFVRRCHGDLHLRNIVLWRGHPVLFDAIEFDEDLATTDTLYDLAFLLMDLDIRRQRPAANVILNRYLWRSGDPLDLEGLAALPLLLGLRAAIRAMVTAQRVCLAQAGADSRDVKIARGYLRAALGYLAPAPARLVAVGGLSGTGKSTLAMALAPGAGPAPGAVHLRSDLERKSLFGVAETERLAPEHYTPATSAEVYDILYRKARAALAAGHAVIVDAVFAKAEERAAIEAVANDLGTPFHGLWLTAPPEHLLARVDQRTGDASDATPGVVRQQLAWQIGALSPPWAEIDAGGSPAATLARASQRLA